jgi:DNA-binding helix-hairpin-helix protein with protein kinase domain
MGSGETVELAETIGVGAGGHVYAVNGRPELVAKLYRRTGRSIEPRAARLEAMLGLRDALARGPLAARLAWPLDSVCDESGEVRGFVMRRVTDSRQLGELVDGPARTSAGLTTTWRWPLRAAAHLALAVALAHRAGLTVGDLSDANVLLARRSARATLVYCDTISLPGEPPARGPLTVETAAPEILADTGPRSQATDAWPLAVLVCELLMEGEHPFLGTPVGGPGGRREPQDNMRDRLSRFVDEGAVDVPAAALPLDILPPEAHALAARCFREGHDDPGRRPTAREWVHGLASADAKLRTCRDLSTHVYAPELRDCPWCARADAGLNDPFAGGTRAAA